jgi:hypothetical protein
MEVLISDVFTNSNFVSFISWLCIYIQARSRSEELQHFKHNKHWYSCFRASWQNIRKWPPRFNCIG